MEAATATAVREHPDVQEAHGRLVDLRKRKSELEEELRSLRRGEAPTTDDLAEDYDGELPDDGRRTVGRVQEEIRVVNRAITRAKGSRNSAKQAARSEVLEELGPRYRESLARVARHARALLEEAETEAALREEARELGLKPLASRHFHRPPVRELRAWLERVEQRFDV